MNNELIWSGRRPIGSDPLSGPGSSPNPGAPAAPVRDAFPIRHRWLEAVLARVDGGTLELQLPDGARSRYGSGAAVADLRIDDWKVCSAVLRRGDIGFAEAFVEGGWSSSDPARLLSFLLRNRQAAERAIYGSFLGGIAYRVGHWLRSNTRSQAKRNIVAHYDLGNDFYALWLDPSMSYSSALFDEASDPHEAASVEVLQRAQQAKYRRVLDELALSPGARVLELGCGWGGFAEAAARDGLHTTGLTLSPAQLAYANDRLAAQGLGADLKLRDYRDEDARYDGIASIEMFEAVGERYWPSYFDTLARCLREGGARVRADDHDRRRAVRSLPARNRFRPTVRIPGRDAAVAIRLRGARRARRVARDRAPRLRRALRAHARHLAGALRRGVAASARARLRRALRSPLVFLPLLLRSGVRRTQLRCHPVHARATLARRGPSRCAARS